MTHEAAANLDPYAEQHRQLEQALDAMLAGDNASERRAAYDPVNIREVGVVVPNKYGHPEAYELRRHPEGFRPDAPDTTHLAPAEGLRTTYILGSRRPGEVEKRWQGHNPRSATTDLTELEDLNTRLQSALTFDLRTERFRDGRIEPKNFIRRMGRAMLGRSK